MKIFEELWTELSDMISNDGGQTHNLNSHSNYGLMRLWIALEILRPQLRP